MKWLAAAGMLGLLVSAAILLLSRPRPTWSLSHEDALPRARPYMHRSFGSRMHAR